MAVNGNGSSWWRQQVTVGNIVQIAVIAFGLAGFYFTTSATLSSHAKAIDVQAKAMTEVIADIRRLDREAALERDKTRVEMVQRAERTADGIAELNKRMAVAETKYDAIKDELIKIGRQLEAVITKTR
jgi:hypothetical protein